MPGMFVSLEDTIRSFKAICDGEYDHLPESRLLHGRHHRGRGGQGREDGGGSLDAWPTSCTSRWSRRSASCSPGEVDQVDAPGSEGDFGVLAGHAPFMTTLKEGRVKAYDDGEAMVFEVRGGFADVTAGRPHHPGRARRRGHLAAWPRRANASLDSALVDPTAWKQSPMRLALVSLIALAAAANAFAQPAPRAAAPAAAAQPAPRRRAACAAGAGRRLRRRARHRAGRLARRRRPPSAPPPPAAAAPPPPPPPPPTDPTAIALLRRPAEGLHPGGQRRQPRPDRQDARPAQAGRLRRLGAEAEGLHPDGGGPRLQPEPVPRRRDPPGRRRGARPADHRRAATTGPASSTAGALPQRQECAGRRRSSPPAPGSSTGTARSRAWSSPPCASPTAPRPNGQPTGHLADDLRQWSKLPELKRRRRARPAALLARPARPRQQVGDLAPAGLADQPVAHLAASPAARRRAARAVSRTVAGGWITSRPPAMASIGAAICAGATMRGHERVEPPVQRLEQRAAALGPHAREAWRGARRCGQPVDAVAAEARHSRARSPAPSRGRAHRG